MCQICPLLQLSKRKRVNEWYLHSFKENAVKSWHYRDWLAHKLKRKRKLYCIEISLHVYLLELLVPFCCQLLFVLETNKQTNQPHKNPAALALCKFSRKALLSSTALRQVVHPAIGNDKLNTNTTQHSLMFSLLSIPSPSKIFISSILSMNDSHKWIPLGKERRKKNSNSYHITLTKLLNVYAVHSALYFHTFGEKGMW